MIRRFWPSSLYSQILFAAGMALLVVQLINAAVGYQNLRNRLTAEAAWMVSTITVNNLRRDVGGRASDLPPVVKITRSAAPITPDGFYSAGDLAEHVAEQVRSVDRSIEAVRLSTGPMKSLPVELRPEKLYRGMRGIDRTTAQYRPKDAVLLTLRLNDGGWINAVAAVRPYRAAPIAGLLTETLLLYLAVLIPLAFLASRIARPLKMLTQRVSEVGLAGDAMPIMPRGPSDVRELIEAFNGAEARLSALLTEKDVMLGAIGHDLKTPLASLRVRIESVDDEVERNKMASTIDEMAQILDDILTLARLGKSSEAAVLTDMDALVETVAAEMDADGMLSIAGNHEKWRALVRPVVLRRALRNLVGNALQYGRTATISVGGDANWLDIIIDDEGPGIPTHQVDAMFEPFTRAEGSRNRAHGGTGLGLTIARAIARAHGGDVLLENRVAGGLRAILRVRR